MISTQADKIPSVSLERDEFTYQLEFPKLNEAVALSEYDSLFKRAVAFQNVKRYKEAADLFNRVYEWKPDYPTLAAHYGDCLYRLEKYEKAVVIWESVPRGEKYKHLDLLRGSCYANLQKFTKASKYYKKALKALNKTDWAYWTARAFLIWTEHNMGEIDRFADSVFEFCEVVDNEKLNILNVKREIIPGTKDDFTPKDLEPSARIISSLDHSAFFLLDKLSKRLCREGQCGKKALEASYRAAKYVKGPFSFSIIIDEDKYLGFLTALTGALQGTATEHRDLGTLDSILREVDEHNRSNKNFRIVDMAMLIRTFYLDWEQFRPLKKGRFRLQLYCTVGDKEGLRQIVLSSPKYLFGQQVVVLNGEKERKFEKALDVDPNTSVSEPPIIRVKVKDTQGGTSELTIPCSPIISVMN
jgi:tetratricopeptide (TPR) repeat protein